MDAEKKSSRINNGSYPSTGGAHDSANGFNTSMERLTEDFSPTTTSLSTTPPLSLPAQSPGMARRLKRSRQSLKRAMTRLHRTLINLDSFRALTYTACVKILKKHDKLARRYNSVPKFYFALKFKLRT